MQELFSHFNSWQQMRLNACSTSFMTTASESHGTCFPTVFGCRTHSTFSLLHAQVQSQNHRNISWTSKEAIRHSCIFFASCAVRHKVQSHINKKHPFVITKATEASNPSSHDYVRNPAPKTAKQTKAETPIQRQAPAYHLTE